MNPRFLAMAALIAAAAGMSWLSPALGQQAGTATLIIKLPPDAKLYFDGAATQQIGPTRTFVTPPLKIGSKYVYTLKAEVVRGGKLLSQTKQIDFQAGVTVPVDFSGVENQASAGQPAAGAESPDVGWPRTIQTNNETITIYQPQVDSWDKNLLMARAAVALAAKASPQQTFGVVWFTARTDVDREARTVILDDLKITKVNFPSAADKEEPYLALLKTKIPAGSKTVSLDRLEANLAITQAESKVKKLPLKNEPPQIIYTTKPAVLVLVDGPPTLRPVANSKLLRVINTRALMLLDQDSGTYYLHFVNGWLQAKAAQGPWEMAAAPPAALDAVKQSLANAPGVDLLDDPAPDLKQDMEKGIHPDVHVSTVPAELLEINGEPDFTPIGGTALLYLKNTTNEVVLDTSSQDYFVLLSGRWFKSKSLQKGPWEFVAGDQLPADIAKIPENHPLGDVLSSVAGTPQAKEALIANKIPQTATIKRSEAKLAPVYDGDPKFEPIEDTPLQYAVNTPTPVLQTAPQTYYAVENGVWFVAAAPTGPWIVADTVPAVIYSIPPSSPLYYVTYVQVYGGTPDVVYVGYTPGYFGACFEPWGTVVYGTGWNYRPWIGNYWYGRPWTFGCAVSFHWSTVGGWSFGFGAGIGRPWWGPVGWNATRGGVWRAGWETGWGGRYANVHATNIHVNNFNAYNRWPTNSLVQRNTAALTAVQRTNVVAGRTLNNVYAGKDGAVFQKSVAGWQQHTATGAWKGVQSVTPSVAHLNTVVGARNFGSIQAQTFHATGGFAGAGGVHAGGFSGYRGISGGGIRRR